jgi:D-tyrosyl-tRNA(Tyr) deacylase
LWEDEAGRRWARSATDCGNEILCVSQFTLYHTMKGNKPDFRQAMTGSESSILYQVTELYAFEG